MINNNLMPMKTKCAFHQSQQIIYFCKCEDCLLPLCPHCVPIHKQEHKNIPEPMNMLPIDQMIKEINFNIGLEFSKLKQFEKETMRHYHKNEQEHLRIRNEVIVYRDELLQAINSAYDSLFIQMENSAIRRKQWLRKLNISLQELNQELQSLLHSLHEEKYLRTVIMWNKLKPFELTNQIIRKSQKPWLTPSFQSLPQQNLINLIVQNTKLHLLEIDGHSGIEKWLKYLKILRFGEEHSNSSQTGQISTVFYTETKSEKEFISQQPRKMLVTSFNRKF